MRVPFRFLILALPLSEIAVFILVGGWIGVPATLALVLLAGIAGAALLRVEGTAALFRIRAELADDSVPARPLLDGALIAVAAILLIVPGFLTDIAGLVLCFPAVRARISDRVALRLRSGLRPQGVKSAAGPVVDLDPTEYARTGTEYAAPSSSDSPWRQDRQLP